MIQGLSAAAVIGPESVSGEHYVGNPAIRIKVGYQTGTGCISNPECKVVLAQSISSCNLITYSVVPSSVATVVMVGTDAYLEITNQAEFAKQDIEIRCSVYYKAEQYYRECARVSNLEIKCLYVLEIYLDPQNIIYNFNGDVTGLVQTEMNSYAMLRPN